MNKTIRTILCLTLCGVMLLGLCACGNAGTGEEETNPTFDPATYDPMQSYHVSKENNTFSYQILDHKHDPIHTATGLKTQPQFTKLTDSILQITGPSAQYSNGQWALFCDVRNRLKSEQVGNFLMATDTHMVYIENLTGAYRVFVREFFSDERMDTPLPGLELDKDFTLYQNAELNEDGDLAVTYHTKDGSKTVLVNIP